MHTCTYTSAEDGRSCAEKKMRRNFPSDRGGGGEGGIVNRTQIG